MERKNFPSHKKDWKKIESNSKSIALNILYIPHNTKKIRHAYKSKHNLSRKNQVIFLMIADGKRWHYFSVKKLSSLFWGVTLNHKEYFYCLTVFTHIVQKENLENIKMYAKIMIITM